MGAARAVHTGGPGCVAAPQAHAGYTGERCGRAFSDGYATVSLRDLVARCSMKGSRRVPGDHRLGRARRVALALAVRSEDAFAPIVFGVTLPLLLLSGVLLPLQLAPDWLRAVASFNPLKYAVDAARSAFNANLGDLAVAQGFGVMVVLAAVAVVLAARSFGRAVA